MKKDQKEHLENTIAIQRKRIAEQEAALKQISDVADSIIACVAAKYGEKTDEGYTIELETDKVTGALAKYKIIVDKEGDRYVITAREAR